ncbi:MAG: type 4 pilus major pilin [Vicinamibacterales bacterium]
MKSLRTLRKQAGLTLIEAMVWLALLGVVIGGTLYYQSRSDASQKSTQAAADLTYMASKAKAFYKPSGSYSALTAANLNKMALVNPPMVYDGSNLKDAWGNTMSVAGGTLTFAISVGGSTNPLDKEACTNIASTMVNNATSIRIGSAAAVTTTGATQGQVSGGNAYKTAGTVPDAAAMATGCNESNPIIAIQF